MHKESKGAFKRNSSGKRSPHTPFYGCQKVGIRNQFAFGAFSGRSYPVLRTWLASVAVLMCPSTAVAMLCHAFVTLPYCPVSDSSVQTAQDSYSVAQEDGAALLSPWDSRITNAKGILRQLPFSSP